jgi:hypothetical protein
MYVFKVAKLLDLLNPVSACGFVVWAELVGSDEAKRAPRRLLRSKSRWDPLRQLIVNYSC